jgi:hypothetical protein
MNTPGFNAEASLYRTNERYYSRSSSSALVKAEITYFDAWRIYKKNDGGYTFPGFTCGSCPPPPYQCHDRGTFGLSDSIVTFIPCPHDHILGQGRQSYTVEWDIQGCEYWNCNIRLDHYDQFLIPLGGLLLVPSNSQTDLSPSGRLDLETNVDPSIYQKLKVLTVKRGSDEDSSSVWLGTTRFG